MNDHNECPVLFQPSVDSVASTTQEPVSRSTGLVRRIGLLLSGCRELGMHSDTTVIVVDAGHKIVVVGGAPFHEWCKSVGRTPESFEGVSFQEVLALEKSIANHFHQAIAGEYVKTSYISEQTNKSYTIRFIPVEMGPEFVGVIIKSRVRQ